MPAEPGQSYREQVKLRLSSSLPNEYRGELERIVYFNPNQKAVKESVVDAVRCYGSPTIVLDGPYLRFRLPAFGPVQSLFALDDSASPAQLLGVIMFVRDHDNPDTMLVLHLATHEDFAGSRSESQSWVALQLMDAVRSLSLQIRGIDYLRVLYLRGYRMSLR